MRTLMGRITLGVVMLLGISIGGVQAGLVNFQNLTVATSVTPQT